MTKLAEIARTISLYAQPGMKAKALMETVREHHPDASKKDISRGAFYAVILAAESDPSRVSSLHDIAMSARGNGDGADVGSSLIGIERPKKTKKTKH